MFQKHPIVDFRDENYLNIWCDFLGISKPKDNACFIKKKLQILNCLSKQPIIYKTWSNRKRFILKNLLDSQVITEYRKKTLLPFDNSHDCYADESIYRQIVGSCVIPKRSLEIETEYSIFAFERPLSTASLSGSTLLIGSFDGDINLYETNTFTKISSHCKAHVGKINDSVCINEDSFLTAGFDGKIFLVSKGNTSMRFSSLNPLQCLSINPSFPILSVAEKFYKITFLDFSNFKPIVSQKCHNGSIHAVDFDTRGFIYATVGSDKKTNIWDFRSGKLLNSLRSNEEVMSVKFSSCDYQLFTGCDSGTVRNMDLRNFSVINEVYGHSSLVVSLRESNNLLLSCSYDGCINIYDPLNLRILSNQKIHDGKITDLVIKDPGTNNFTEFITCGYDKTFKKGIIK